MNSHVEQEHWLQAVISPRSHMLLLDEDNLFSLWSNTQGRL